jgi:hypothetical protein
MALQTQLNRSQVKKVYSGRPGCACGCRGKYYYSAFCDLEAAGKARGYPINNDEVNDRQITRVVNTINKYSAMANYSECGQYVELDLGHRVYVAFLEH